MKKGLKKALAVSLTAALSCSAVSSFSVSAAETKSYTVTKISNPDSKIDGLVKGGDRETSYAWCLAERGNYIYIGTNKNIVGSVVSQFEQALVNAGLDSDTVWAITDVVTNGEIPRPTTNEGGYIFRCSKSDNSIEKIYTAPKGVSFRMAVTYGNNVYFGSYSAVESGNNDILKIDENDKVETVFSSNNGTSMRAACIYDNQLYFGGVDASETLADGDENCKKLAVLRKDDNDDSKWTRVADYKDFKQYASNPAVYGSVTSPIWDICSFDGYIYATIPNTAGFVVYKGHPAANGESANEYGWNWTEVVGNTNGINNIGLADSSDGYTGASQALLSIVATPFVFKDDLYIMDFDHTIGSETQAISGILGTFQGSETKASDYLRSMYNTLRHPQSIWKLNKQTGKFEKIEAFSEFMDGTCNEYLWRAEEYDGEMYISTMDSSVIYNYITKLTNGNFINMTDEEWGSQISYLEKLCNLTASKTDEETASQIYTAFAQAKEMMTELKNMDIDKESVNEYLSNFVPSREEYLFTVGMIKAQLAEINLDEIADAVIETLSSKPEIANGDIESIIAEVLQDETVNQLISQYANFANEEELQQFIAQAVEQIQAVIAQYFVIPDYSNVDFDNIPANIDWKQYLPEDMSLENLPADFDWSQYLPEDFDWSQYIPEDADLTQYLPEDADLAQYLPEDFDWSQYLPEGVSLENLPENTDLTQYLPEDFDWSQYLPEDFDWSQYIPEDFDLTQYIPEDFDLTQYIPEDFDYSSLEMPDFSNLSPEEKAELKAQIKQEISSALEGFTGFLDELYNAVDWEGLEMYQYISNMVKDNTAGFDIIKTSDFEHFEVITNDGFGDKYNYGGRSLIATDNGLYIGTSNPFYGAQLYLLKNTGESNNSNETPTPAPTNTNTNANDTAKSDAQKINTSDNTPYSSIALIGLLSAVTAGIAVIAGKKKKEEK